MEKNLNSKYSAGINKKIFETFMTTKRSPSQNMLKQSKHLSSTYFSIKTPRADFNIESSLNSRTSLKASNSNSLQEKLKILGEKFRIPNRVKSLDLQDDEALFYQKVSIRPPDEDSIPLAKNNNLYSKRQLSQEIETFPLAGYTHSSSEVSNEKNEHSIKIAGSAEKANSSSFNDLQKLYEEEKIARQNFENLYIQLHENYGKLRMSFEDLSKNLEENSGLLKSVQIENYDLKSSNKRLESQKNDALEKINALEKEKKGLLENFNKPSNRNLSLIDTIKSKLSPQTDSSDNKDLNSIIDQLKLTIKNLQAENQELKSREAVSGQNKVKSLFETNEYLKKSAEIIKSTLHTSENNELILLENTSLIDMIQSLRAQLESSSHIQEINSLKEKLEETKSENECQKSVLQQKIQNLKKDNKEIFYKLKEKMTEWDHYQSHALLRNTATNLTEQTLAGMTKEELLQNFNLLNKEYEELRKKMISQADEMFENKSENKQLQMTKSKLLKELAEYQKQESELNVLKDHVSYLLSVIQTMKEKIKKIRVFCSDNKTKEDIENENTKKSLAIISELLKIEIVSLSEKRSQINWKDDRGKKALVDCVMNEFYNLVVGRKK